MTFTHSLAQINPTEFLTDGLPSVGSTILSYNKQPQYTSYNGDIYTTVGVVPSFFDITTDDLYYDFFGQDNMNIVDANQFDNFNFVFDIYQLDENIPNLQDILGYRYNQYEMYGINEYAAGKKIKNLGRYKVTPNPETGLGSLNISRILRGHKKMNDSVNTIKDMLLQANNQWRNIQPWVRPDTENVCKWKVEYGFEVNPGLTFSDTYYSLGSYVNPATGLAATYSLGFTFSYEHYLKYGDEIIIQMDDLGLNTTYNGLCYVVDVVNPYHIVVDKQFGLASTNEGGTITYLLRINEIQSGNWWKYFGSQLQGLSYSVGFDSYQTEGLGFMNGRQTTNYSINSTIQRKPNLLSNNFGQVGYLNGGITIGFKNPINDVSGLLINRFTFQNNRINYTNADIEPSVNLPRFFMTNWDDKTMGRKELNFYYWGAGGESEIIFPDYTLGILTHQNYWPAYYRNFDSLPQTYGDKLCTVPSFNYIRWTLKDSAGNVKNTAEKAIESLIPYLLSNNANDEPIKDYEKLEAILSTNAVFSSIVVNLGIPEQDDILVVELVKKYFDTWTFSYTEDYNVILDFDGLDNNYNQIGYGLNVSPYPFHYQFTDYFDPFCENRGVFKGPFGSRQNNQSTVSPFDPANYNFLNELGGTVSQADVQWPLTFVPGAPDNKGNWYSEMQFVVNDPSCNFQIDITMKTMNELFTDYELEGWAGNNYLPAGTYSFDFEIQTATQSYPDILGFYWGIGNEVSQGYNSVGLYLDQELYTEGGHLFFRSDIDPAGQILVRPFKIRHKSDLVMGKKEFKCNLICRGSNPYTTPFGKWDYGQKIELMFLNRLGSYERLYFDYDSKKTINIQRREYMKSFNRDKWGQFNSNLRDKGILSQKATEQYLINSDWISQNKLSFYEELLTSPEVFVVEYYPNDVNNGSNKGPAYSEFPFFNLHPVNIKDTTFQQKTYLRDKLFNLQLTFELAFDTNLQQQ